MTKVLRAFIQTLCIAGVSISGTVSADGIVSRVVNSPLSGTGTVRDAKVGINVWLQNDDAKDGAFFDPNIVGFGIPAGGRVEIELAKGFERDPAVPITQKSIMVVTGTPQQGMPGKAVGYEVSEGANPNTIVIAATKPEGLPAETLVSPAPGAKDDSVPQRGIKVFHIGLLESPFFNRGNEGVIEVRFLDGNGKAVAEGSGSVAFLASPVAQIQPSNFPDRQRSHNWQSVKAGETLGKSAGTLPISYGIYARAEGLPAADLVNAKDGLTGVGVASTQQLAAMKFELPAPLARYNGGLVIHDTNGDGLLDPASDQIIGGVIGSAPDGASGQELRSLDVHGAVDLSKPATAYNPKAGKSFGGAIGLLQFTAGDKPGLYQPTMALLSDPNDTSSPDGSSYTFTIVVQ